MATLNATPADISLVVGRAMPGDTIILTAGTYTAFPQKAGVTYQAFDWAPGRAIMGTTGYLGTGFGVRVTTSLNLNQPGMVLKGIHHDTRGLGSINAGVFTASNITLEDHVLTGRRTDGARQIGYTFGSGAIRVSGIRVLRARLNRVGKLNDLSDHALYMKNCTGCRVEDTILHDAGRFPIHFYPNADNNEIIRPIIWGSMGAVVFSGANDASTGVAASNSENNVIRNGILGAGTYARGYLVESQWDGVQPGQGNRVENTNITVAGGSAGLVEPTLSGVTLTGIVDFNPAFRNASVGDFTRTGTYDGYGPAQLFGTVEPPPPPPPPPTEDARDVLLADLRVDLEAIRTLVVRALGRYPQP